MERLLVFLVMVRSIMKIIMKKEGEKDVSLVGIGMVVFVM